MIAGIETGGTKVIAAVAAESAPHQILELIEIPTTTPLEVGEQVRALLDRWQDSPQMQVGVASFGPVDLDPSSRSWAHITSTPKPGWSNTSIVDLVGPNRSVSVVSDVTGAVIGETTLSGKAGERNVAYVTVGTGVGVGAIVDGRPLSSHSHPEIGHISVRRHPEDTFGGVCPFHGDCIEGLASGPSLAQRWGRSTRELADVLDTAVAIEASYLGQLLATVTYALVPDRIILGGGVTKIPGVLDGARRALRAEIAGALGTSHPSSTDTFVTLPRMGDLAGVHGALELAHSSHRRLARQH